MEADKEPLVAVSYRIKPSIRQWLAAEAREKHDRPANWLVNRLLEEAFARAQTEQGGRAPQ